MKKILVANRGEIAVRVIRACKELGISTVAVYSELDRNALHVRLADEAYALGGQTAAESYLRTDAILDAISQSGADGVHPGYGFLSENGDFAEAVTSQGAIFIGPPPDAIAIMGDKISAREAAEKVGVHSVPGMTDPVTVASQVESFAEEHGYPVAVKAAFGGGGRGMKVINEGEDIDAAIASAARESLSSFGRDELYLERYLKAPRHVEVQVLADAHGNCVHLGTRDCSAQRRHQKLIEEAPAPGIETEILEAMGQAAITVALGCGYRNAGTVEFLYEDGQFYYLEMNTRLQVEHPVTEMVFDIDLVAEQISIARGEPLSFTQADVRPRGHAIEVRVNAEDPAGGAFLPSPGTISSLRLPDGYGTRFDTGYEAGDEVSPLYDNLVGKLVCWGADREIARRRTLRALEEMSVEGVATTIPAAIAILQHDDFASLAHSTKWVEETLDLSHITAAAPSPPDGADASATPKTLSVEVDSKKFSVTVWLPDAAPADQAVRTRRASAGASLAGSGSGTITVPMQGTVISVLVAVGDEVEAGQPLLVLEAMKMENNINADKAGTVKEIKVSEGDSVGSGDIVAIIE